MNKQNSQLSEQEDEAKSEVSGKDDDHVETCKPSQNNSIALLHNTGGLPMQIQRLHINTNLNQYPPNWMQCQEIYNLFRNSIQKDRPSFRLATEFLDYINKVDVVTTSPNIKKLLKMAYTSNSHISMAIHRIGKTLFIDEFDITSLLFGSDQSLEPFKQFISNLLQSSELNRENVLVRPNKSRGVIQKRNLFSKFLHYSVEDKQKVEHPQQMQTTDHHSGHSIRDSRLPDPCDEAQPAMGPPCERKLIWNFENLCMLIGTDLPIFGGYDSPCISLRLNDLSKPINVLTGIDYWLDNLMSNVPEVLMCFHQDGIVQNYEVVKTEDLPKLPDSKFSPKAVQDMAQNVLNFLNCRATKEGHTYWLLKGKEDQYIKLYDLTSLSESFEMEGSACHMSDKMTADENPFAVPVAMLLYKVADNLSKDLESSTANHSNICALLKESLKLLDQHKHQQVCCSAHYLLANTYLPYGLDPDSPHLSDVSDNEDSVTVEPKNKKTNKKRKGKSASKEPLKHEITLESLRAPHSKREDSETVIKRDPLPKDIQVRCKEALSYIIDSLKSLIENKTKEDEVHAEPKLANSSQPIPMPYAPLNNKQVVLAGTGSEIRVSVGEIQYTVFSWQEKLLLLHLQKAALIHHIFARITFNQYKYGSALRYLSIAMKCWMAIIKYLKGESCRVPYNLAILACDCYYALTQRDLTQYIASYEDNSCKQNVMEDILSKILEDDDGFELKMPSSQLEGLQLAYECLMKASKPDDDTFIKRKIAGIGNDVAKALTNRATELFQNDKDEASVKTLMESTLGFEKSLSTFIECNDTCNIALLHSNLGRNFRLQAAWDKSFESWPMLTKFQVDRLQQAMSHYESALGVIGLRSQYPHLWDTILESYYKAILHFGTELLKLSCETLTKPEALKYAEKIVSVCANGASEDIYKNNPIFKLISIDANMCLGLVYFHPKYSNPEMTKEKRITLGHLRMQSAIEVKKKLCSTEKLLRMYIEYFIALDECLKTGDFDINLIFDNRVQLLRLIGDLAPMICKLVGLPIKALRNRKKCVPVTLKDFQLSCLMDFHACVQKVLLGTMILCTNHEKIASARLKCNELRSAYKFSLSKSTGINLYKQVYSTIERIQTIFI